MGVSDLDFRNMMNHTTKIIRFDKSQYKISSSCAGFPIAIICIALNRKY